MDNGLAMKILGLSLILLSIYFYFFSDKIKVPINKWSALIGGGISGLMGGLMGVPGPPIVLYYSVALPKKEAYLATIQTFFLINDLIRVFFLTQTMTITPTMFKSLPIAFVTAVVGLMLGNAAFKRMSSKGLQQLIYAFMSLSGLYYLIK